MEIKVVVSALDDRFCLSPHVVSSNWRNVLFCMQFLCGDVHLNPGPCSKCGLNVVDDSKA